MITLYGKTGCQHTAKAIAALDALGLSFTKKNIADPAVVEELVALGGKRQVPYIIDGDVRMYESDDIVEYLRKKYGSSFVSPTEVRVHATGGSSLVCAS